MLHNWDFGVASHNRVLTLPFQGTKLFGDGLDHLSVKIKGKQDVAHQGPCTKDHI